MVTHKTNSFLENFHSKKLSFAWYLLGSLIIIIFSFLGQIPTLFFLPHQLPSSGNQMDVFAHLDSNLTLFLILVSYFIAFFGFLFVVYRIHKQTITSVTTSRLKIDFKRILFGFLFWGGLSIFLFGIDVFLSPEDYLWNFKPIPFFGGAQALKKRKRLDLKKENICKKLNIILIKFNYNESITTTAIEKKLRENKIIK